jgi:metal-dependent HD superfamily phosphatase/phosphodiesterase
MKSEKEISLDNKLMGAVGAFGLSGKAVEVMGLLLKDDEVQMSQEYANTVSIVRLGYNDHGPVHMRSVAMNALIMLRLLREAKVKTSLESDGCGDFEDSISAVILASMLHDLGMGTGRQDHELYGVNFAFPIIDRILSSIYGTDMRKRVIIRALSLECISGHMGTRTIHSLEAGVVQVADGCDMTKGRARIPLALWSMPKTGHIHQYSANSIEEVRIVTGKDKPIRIDICMSNESGFFQVEEVLLKKIAASPAKPFIELYAQVRKEDARQYL